MIAKTLVEKISNELKANVKNPNKKLIKKLNCLNIKQLVRRVWILWRILKTNLYYCQKNQS